VTLAIEFKNFSFKYLGSQNYALRGINLEIEEGSIVGVIGPTGSGKSTLLMALNGVVPKFYPGVVEGEVKIYGIDTKEHEIAKLASYVGLVLQKPDIQLFSPKVWDDVAYGPSNLGLPKEEIITRVYYALEATRLKGFESRNPITLSGGEQQSLAIAGILAMRPKIMALDEPIAMLDPIGKRRVLSVVKQLAEEHNLTIIISESGADIELVADIIETTIVLHHGRVALTGDPEEVFKSKLLDAIKGIRPPVTELFIRLSKKYPVRSIPINVTDAVEELSKEFGETKIPDEKIKELLDRILLKPKALPHDKKPLIKVRNLHHTYPLGVHALKGITLNIYEGEIVGLIGQNGSGKTTFAKHLVGLLKPTNKDAEVLVKGLDVTKEPTSKVIRIINYVFQDPDKQLFSDSVWEEIAFGLKQLEYLNEEIEEKTSKVMELVGLSEYKEDYPGHLPVHLRKFVALASVLVLEPEILIVDEPTTGLGEEQINEILSLLAGLVEKGRLKSLIVITHDMDSVAKYCSRVICMHDGQIVLDGSPREVFTKIDVLNRISIAPPQITQLASLLSRYGIPPYILTVEEMLNLLEAILSS